MSLKFSHFVLLLIFICFLSPTLSHNGEDPVAITMEEFSGYPIHESHSHSVSSLTVDAQSLQKQVGTPPNFVNTVKDQIFTVMGFISWLVHFCLLSFFFSAFMIHNFITELIFVKFCVLDR